MFKTILLTVDTAQPASWAKALPQAADLARASGGTLHILAVVPDYDISHLASYLPEGFQQSILTRTKEALDTIIATAVPNDVTAVAHLNYGAVHERILAAIDDLKVDLVVMASHKPDVVHDFLIGSQADRVVRRSPVSVLVVRG